jgi:hypothetical protein
VIPLPFELEVAVPVFRAGREEDGQGLGSFLTMGGEVAPERKARTLASE